MPIFSGNLENDTYKEFVDAILHIMKTNHPTLTHQILFDNVATSDVEPMQNIMPFTNINLELQSPSRQTECIDFLQFHIPYMLKSVYIKLYIQCCIIHHYFVNINDGFESVHVENVYIKWDDVFAEEDVVEDIVNLNTTSCSIGDAMLQFTEQQFTEQQFFNDLYLCVITNDFRNQVSFGFTELSPSFYIDTVGEPNNVPAGELESDIDNNVSLFNYTVSGGNYYQVNMETHGVYSSYMPGFGISNRVVAYDGVHDRLIGENQLMDDDVFTTNSDIPEYSEQINVNFAPLESLIIPKNSRTNECPVCYDTITVLDFYDCQHGICTSCFESWKDANHHTCPMCRANYSTYDNGINVYPFALRLEEHQLNQTDIPLLISE